jgi:hypothetical protein
MAHECNHRATNHQASLRGTHSRPRSGHLAHGRGPAPTRRGDRSAPRTAAASTELKRPNADRFRVMELGLKGKIAAFDRYQSHISATFYFASDKCFEAGAP